MIIVTGVHRSGTSLLAMLLDSLGIDFGDPSMFYAADQWNEQGYFERRDIIDVNSRLLTGFPRTNTGITSAISKTIYLANPRVVTRTSARNGAMVRDIADAIGGLAVKDPRFCLTLSVWETEASIEKCLVSLRPPEQVARSLHRRQNIPRSLAYRFWARHAEGLLQSRSENRLYVRFDHLTGSHTLHELMRIREFLGLDLTSAQLTQHFSERFSPDLKHVSDLSDDDMPTRVKALWSELQAIHAGQ